MTLSIRRPLGILALVIALFAYVIFVVWLFEPIGRLHPLLQLPLWMILGIGWIFPCRPLLVWIETGHLRLHKPKNRP